MALARAVPVLAVVAALGCAGDGQRLAHTAQRVQPYLDTFRSFERWARRAGAGERLPRSREAAAELLFAPIRRAPLLLAAWVRFDADPELVLALPREAQLQVEPAWIALRDADMGTLRVAVAERCPLALPAGWRREPAAECVLIAHGDPRDSSGEPSVTMAFATAPVPAPAVAASGPSPSRAR